jgi:hypothetical protein
VEADRGLQAAAQAQPRHGQGVDGREDHRADGVAGPRLVAVPDDDRPATVADVHAAALAMPGVRVWPGRPERPVYQVGGKSFVFFRTSRPDAVDPQTGERYDDVIVIWVPSADDKLALVQDPDSPFFTTPHFDGHLSVLVRAGRLSQVSRSELTEIVQDAWLSVASPTRVRAWLRDHAAADRDDGGAPRTHS